MTRRAAHYTTRIANDICMYIALGSTLEEALAKVGYLAPSMPTLWRWLSEHDDFRVKMDQARQLQADTLADKTLGFVDKVLDDPKAAPAYKVATDILKWHAEIRKPDTYAKGQQEGKRKTPLDPKKIKEEIKRLEKELGVQERGQQDKTGKVVSLKSMDLSKKVGE